MLNKSHDRIVILGAGPAGLTAGYEALRRGFKNVAIFERDAEVGGLAKTVRFQGHRFDIGGHRFFSKSPWAMAWWHSMLGKDFRPVDRLSRIYYKGRFFHYPLEPFNALKMLGIWEALLIVFSYLRARLAPIQPESTFEAWMVNRFGWRLYKTFFKSYTEKVWGVSTKELSADWARQRIREFTLGMVIRQALTGSKQNGNGVITKTLTRYFHYPRLGPGMMWEKTAREIEHRGGLVATQTSAVALHHARTTSLEIVLAREAKPVKADWVISTLPLPRLLELLVPAPPETVRHALEALRYRDFLTVVLVVKRAHVFADQWLYIHEPHVKVGRIQNYKNWSRSMVADKKITCLGMEYFVNQSDELWGAADSDLIALATAELSQIGLVRVGEVEGGTVVRVPEAYPIYDRGYKTHVTTIRQYLDRVIPNLITIGRGGLHRYNNQDHSMLTARAAIAKIAGEDVDPWDVYDEDSYLETQAR